MGRREMNTEKSNIRYFIPKWTCPRCEQVVEPIMGATVIKDKSGYRMRCLTCEPMKERES